MAGEELNRPPSLPPYTEMIFAAIDALKGKEGSNESSISTYIQSTCGYLPDEHNNILTENLNKLIDNGELVVVNNNYMRPDLNTPAKRGRGRPPKAKDPNHVDTPVPTPKPNPDPVSAPATAPQTGSEVKRGRGRPKKDPNAPPSAKKVKVATSPAPPSSTGRSSRNLQAAEMVSKRHKREVNKKTLNGPTTNILKILISALESSSEGIKLQLLKSLYYLLFQLSLKSEGKGAGLCLKTDEGEVRLSLEDVYTLSSILFKMLQKRLQSFKHDRRSLELEELNLLIRCCMLTLTFSSVPQKHLLESARVLLLIFKKLTLLEVAGGCRHGNKKSHSCQCIYSGGNSPDSFVKVATLSSLELFDSCIPSITVILEVVIDELLLHGRLRKYLQMIDSYSPVHERLFKEGTNGGDFGVMMDMICSHFSLSISDEGDLQEFFNRITRVHFINSKSLELSVIASRTLLHNPVLLSSPKLIQAHVVSLVSNVISVGMDNERLTPDPKLVDCCLSVFESSVRLYTQQMSILKTENHSADSRGTLVSIQNKSSQTLFDYCIDPTKKKKLDQKITTFNDSWNSSLRRKFFKNKSDLLASSFEYIQDSCVIDRACKHEIVDFLKCMLVRAANDVNDIELPLNGDASLQDICLLASLLMLMSISLRQSLKNLSLSKQYDSVVGIINCFKDFSVRLPIQVFAYNIMETNPTSHNESRMMLFHFLGLLSLSFDSGLDFLVNGCISVIIGLTDLFFIEGDNIDTLRSLAIKGSPTINQEAQVFRYPTLRVAAKFQKIRKLYLSNVSTAIGSTPTKDVGTENLSTALVPFSMRCVTSTLETCNGELYLKNILKGSGKMTDLDDLADFVECTKGKEYDDWLKGRDKFRKWIKGKWEIHGWQKKKRAWRSIRRNTRFRSKHYI